MNKNEVKLKWEEWLAVIAMCVIILLIAVCFGLAIKRGMSPEDLDMPVVADYLKGNTQPVTSVTSGTSGTSTE